MKNVIIKLTLIVATLFLAWEQAMFEQTNEIANSVVMSVVLIIIIVFGVKRID